MSSPLETYLAEIATLRGATKETSGYGVLQNLLNLAGQSLKPKVKCIIHPKNSGAGIPDGGLFTPDQLKKRDEDEIFGALIPARGVIEVKSVGEEIAVFAESAQVEKYLAHYGQVLLSNYREFLLLKRIGGKTHQLEGFQIAPDENSFWLATAHPRKTADALGERLAEYLKRVMLHNAPLNNPKDVAFFLASYARDAHVRVEQAGDLPALTAIRTALEEALGMKFEAEKGGHFFRSTLVQTIFYGVFSAWVLWHKENPVRKDAFDWRAAAWTLHVPMIKALFEQVATPTKLGPLGLVEVLDWTAAALNRVDRAAFYERFVETHAVQYFYEPFLEAFDPELRKQLGVWYTPPEIVEYMVARVDTALREELGIADGLADPRVFVLDPCCGTGAYLVEVLRKIEHTLREEKGEGDNAGGHMKKAAMERIFGFELLPAPFVIAHLQLGILLQNFGLPLDDAKNERAAIYLTNALTGWEPPKEPKQRLLFPEFQAERDASDHIKQQKPIIVILGNPPYNGFAGIALEEERDLSDAYRTTKHAPAPQGQGLNDLYIRFFRMAERRIVEKSGEGIVCFISNYSWLDGLSFTGMRERYLEVFDGITVDCLNGDKYKTGKLTPEGAPDPSVFSTEHNREGIQVGTAIATLVKRGVPPASERPGGTTEISRWRKPPDRATTTKRPGGPQESVDDDSIKLSGAIRFRHLWGKEKRAELLASLGKRAAKIYETITPAVAVGLPFLPSKTSAGFFKWPLLTELFPVSFPGVQSKQDNLVVDLDREALERRIRDYFNPEISHEEMRAKHQSSMDGTNACEPVQTREYLRTRGLLPHYFVRYLYRPFDLRWIYWEPETRLLGRKSPGFFAQIFPGNVFVEARQRQSKDHFDRGHVTTALADNFGNGFSNFFPLCIRQSADTQSARVQETPDMFAEGGGGGGDVTKPNLTPAASTYLAKLDASPDALFFHTVAVLHSPKYRAENAGALRQDWPRVPLPKSCDTLLASAELGRQVAALLDTETPVAGVNSGKVRAELVKIAVIARLTKEPLNLSLTAGWGHAGQGGVTMPGKGKLDSRDFATDEKPASEALAMLGAATCDIYLNAAACWRNVPANVWGYTIGGYQVLKKWLSYREHALLGRALTADEAREFTHNARRIAALLLLQPELDANYQAVKTATAAWGDTISPN